MKRLFRCDIFCCLLLTFVDTQATAADLQVLPNGMQVVVKENHTAPVTAVRVYVRTGSITEQEYLGAGISHLFEHLINGGSTTSRTETEINELIDKLGGANNAYTTKAHTCYHITTSQDKTGAAIDLIADWMINSTFPKNEYDREMGVVLEELTKGKEEPRRILHQALYEAMFDYHPVRYPTIGYENQVRAITHDDIKLYYNRMYVPNNMVLVVVGDFAADTVMDRIAAAFNPQPPPDPGPDATPEATTAYDQASKQYKPFDPHGIPAISLPTEPKQMGRRDREIRKAGLGGAYFRIAFRTVPIAHRDLYPLDVLSHVLTHGRSSRLVKRLKEEMGLVSAISSYSHTPMFDAGVFVVYGECADANVEKVVDTVLEEVYRATSETVSAAELAKAKRQKVAGEILAKQTAEDEAADIGINVLSSGNPNFGEVYLAGIAKVTTDDILEAAPKYLHDDNLTVTLLRPDALAVVHGGDVHVTASIPIRKTMLPNGMCLLVKENPNIPLVNMRVMFMGGVRLEPGREAGVCRITSELLTRGTTTRSRNEIAEAFDAIGGQLSEFSANNTFGVVAEVLSSDFDEALEIVSDVVQHPTFPAAEFATVQANTLDAIKRRTDRWDREVSYLFRNAYFTEHPYRHDTLGEGSTVRALSAADCKAFYDRHAVPERGIITVFGDVDEDEIIRQVTEAFAGFDRPAPPLPNIAPQTPPTKDIVRKHTVDRQLASLYMGYPGISVTDTSDRYAMEVLDAVLSGIGFPGGRLHLHLRGGDKDLVYVVHAFNFLGLEPGYFGITAASSPAKMDEVIQTILDDIASIRDNPVPIAELEKAKTICITMNQLGQQTNSDRALQAAVDELYGLGYDHADGYPASIAAVTAGDVRRAARKYLTHHVLVRTGPKEK
jgi:zinc protease